jgi:hypothetical protein
MKVWGIRLFLVCAAAAVLVPAATAAAFEFPAQRPSASFTVQGSHGYRLVVEISAGHSSLSATKAASRGAIAESAQYSIRRGTRDGDKFEADFGDLGRVAVRFTATKEARRIQRPACVGGPSVKRFGNFEGTIRFSGEHGYTRVRSTRARGTITSSPQLECDFGGKGRGHRGHSGTKRPGPQITTLSVSSEAHHVFLDADQLKGDPASSNVFALTFERDHGVAISRDVIVSGVNSGFNADAGLNSATLAPSAPFAGSGSFEQIDPYTTRWAGPLAVSFPGRPDVPLTGRDFTWSLSSARASTGSSAVIVGFAGG